MIPPTGHKLYFKDLKKNKRKDVIDGFWFNSGTGALYFLLKNLRIPPRSLIVIPAYTCPTVAAAVLKCGHRPLLCDISPLTLNYNTKMLFELILSKGAAAVIWVNLFGIISTIPEIKIPVIADNAQVYFDDYTNFSAAASIYSFGRGKPVNAMQGGLALIYNQELFCDIHKHYSKIPSSHMVDEVIYLVNVMGYMLFYHPGLYSIPLCIPWFRIGETIFKPEIKMKKMGTTNRKCLENIVERYENIKNMRMLLYKKYQELCAGYKDCLECFQIQYSNRFPILIKSAGLRDKILDKMVEAGIMATGMYPQPLNKQPVLDLILDDISFYENAEYVSQNLLVLPINEFVDDFCMSKIKNILDLFFH